MIDGLPFGGGGDTASAASHSGVTANYQSPDQQTLLVVGLVVGAVVLLALIFAPNGKGK